MENKTIFLLFVALSLFVVGIAGAQVNPVQTDQPIVSATGTAEILAAPNQAELYISVNSEGDVASEVQAENNQVSAEVREALGNAGINESQIETSTYILYKNQPPQPVAQGENATDEGYTLINTLKVTTQDIENTGRIVDAAIGAGANGIERIEFTLTDETERQYREEALQEAARTAQQKARAMAEASGVSLGGLFRLEETQSNVVPPMYGSERAVSDSGAAISPQRVGVTASVVVTYLIG